MEIEYLLEEFPGIQYSAARVNNEADVPDFLGALDYAVCHGEHRHEHMKLLEVMQNSVTEDEFAELNGRLSIMEEHQQLVFACETTIGDEEVRGIVAFLASSVL